MKKFLAIFLALTMVLALAACTAEEAPKKEETSNAMTYAEFAAAELESKVTVQCYVQGTQSWWEDKITVYAQDKDGGYFLYEMACSEADAAKLIPGTKIEVTGTKAEWSGEVEIVDATFKFVGEADDTFVAAPKDLTDALGSDELIDSQNQKALFKGLTVKSVEFKNGEPGDDIYLTVTKDDADYNFCVEMYLTGPETEVYKTVSALEAGDVVDIEAFLYWYEGANPHITAIAESSKP